MSDYTRYAVYFVPPEGPLSRFGAEWLGWDINRATTVAHPSFEKLDITSITAKPRKYGFHATLKPPFRIVENHGEEELQAAIADLADTLPPVTLEKLRLSRIGRFIALTPDGNQTGINSLAAACVREIDFFRSPPTQTELSHRRKSGLSDRQDELLRDWGYPYVMEEFRFHITLSGKLDDETGTAVQKALQSTIVPLLPTPFIIDQIALVGERQDGRFEVIQRYRLSG